MKIYVITHTDQCPINQKPYQPLRVGAVELDRNDRNETWEYDDDYPDNISSKNSTFCELTGLYHIWKHSTEDIVGLVHYRRFLSNGLHDAAAPNTPPCPLSESDIHELLAHHDCIVANKEQTVLEGFAISIAEQYRLCHSSTDLNQLKLVIDRYTPEYSEAFKRVVLGTQFSPYNILICRKKLLDSYAEWLFELEGHLERRIDPVFDRDAYQQRVFGFLAERLLNVYIERHGLRAAECEVFDPTGHLAPQPQKDRAQPRPTIHITDTSRPIMDGIDYSLVFDHKFYLSKYPDLAALYSGDVKGALNHFLTLDLQIDRIASSTFSIASYMHGNPRLRLKYGDDRLAYIRHYLNHRWSRVHATGYENMLAESGTEGRTDTASSSVSWLRKLMFLHYQKLAEHLPVIG